MGQPFTINGGDVSTCQGLLLDSGGQGASGYSDNEDFTITICPTDPDSAISLNFTTFTLSSAGIAPVDELFIYDGNSTSEPLIGSWTGSNSPGIVSASFANPTGCLTVRFISNNTGTGVFSASVTCHTPCEPPTAVAVMSEAAPALICQGEPLGFDGSGSYAANGLAITQYLWDFGDGTMDSTSGPLVNHVFAGSPAQHTVQLQVTDANGCVNTNRVDLVVQISTTPNFQGFDNITHCAGEPVDLTATTSVSGSTWSSIPDVNFGGPVLLPDELGVPFISQVTFNAFPPGSTLASVNDIQSVCVSMEHSFMGDFTLQLTSPTGQSIMLHQQQGGGTYLGGANDTDDITPVPGDCWEYCFSPTATLGTWAACSAGGATPNVMMGGNPPSSALIPGTYSAVQPFSNLIGCQLNGTWTLTFMDQWGIDNGSICSWSINFDPSILPPDNSYTPTPGIMHTDSSYWTGPALTNDPNNPLHYIANPTTVGQHLYTYTVTDNFGCTYDTSLTIIITPGVQVDPYLSPNTVCGQPILLQPGLQLPLPTGVITYQWTPAAGLNNPFTPFPSASPAVPTWYTLHAYPAGHPLCGSADSVLVNPLTTLANDSIVVDHLCFGDNIGSIEVVTNGSGGPWNYTWTDNTGTVVQQTLAANGDTFHGPGGIYQVLVEEGPNGNGCTDSLMAMINEPSPVQIASTSADTVICLTGTAQLQASAIGGTGLHVFHWDHGAGNGNAPTVSPSQTTTFTVYATDVNNCHSDTLPVTVAVRHGLSFHLPDSVVSCPTLDVLLLPDSMQGGDGQYTFDWGQGPSADPSLTVSLYSSQGFCMTLRDGCETPPLTHCTTVAITPVPPLVLSIDSILGCQPFSVNLQLEDTTGGAVADWSFFDGPTLVNRPMSVEHTYTQHGVFNVGVNVTWPNGCEMDSVWTNAITVVKVPDADFSWTPHPADIFLNEVQFHEEAGPMAVSYQWDFGGLGTSTDPDPSFTFPNDTGRYYPVELLVRNYLGCADSMVRMVNVDDAFLVHVPTAFSPDGDGINEVLRVVGNDIADAEFHFMVFNRWGEKIYDSTDRTAGWDGTWKGKNVQNGVYVWMLRAQSRYTGVNTDMRGHVTVVR